MASITSTNAAVSSRRTPEQKREWLKQQLAKTEAELAEKARRRRTRALIIIGSTVCNLRDAALNERLLAEVVSAKDREAVKELFDREGK